MGGEPVERKEIAWYGSLIAILFAVGLMVERSSWTAVDYFRVFDYIITRGALLLGVYLFWRLVRAHERRATLQGRDAGAQVSRERTGEHV